MRKQTCLQAFLRTAPLVAALVLASCAPTSAQPSSAPAAPVASSASSPPPSATVVAPAPAPTSSPVVRPAAPVAPAPTTTPRLAVTTDAPRRGGVLRVLQRADPPGFDPRQQINVDVWGVISATNNAVLQPEPGNATKGVVGDLAQSWEYSTDGKKLTIRFKNGIKWQDGTPFTAEDARYSLWTQGYPGKDLRSPREAFFENVSDIKAIDPLTMEITFKNPDPVFLKVLADVRQSIVPKHVVEKAGDLAFNRESRYLIGTGPFKLDDYKPGVVLKLKRNDSYFKQGMPYLDGLEYLVVRDAATGFAAFRAGRADITGVGTGTFITPAQKSVIERDLKDKVTVYNLAADIFCAFWGNTAVPAWADKKVREAVFLAVDRQAALQNIEGGLGAVGSAFPPGGPWAMPLQEVSALPGYRQPKDQDIAQAKKLMAESSQAAGFQTEIYARAQAGDLKYAEFMSNELGKIGVKATVRPTQLAAFDDAIARKTHSSAVACGGTSLNDPVDYTRYFVSGSAQNYLNISDKFLDGAFGQINSTVDQSKRAALTQDVDRYLMKNFMFVPIAWQFAPRASWNYVRGWPPGDGHYIQSINNRYETTWLAR